MDDDEGGGEREDDESSWADECAEPETCRRSLLPDTVSSQLQPNRRGSRVVMFNRAAAIASMRLIRLVTTNTDTTGRGKRCIY